MAIAKAVVKLTADNDPGGLEKDVEDAIEIAREIRERLDSHGQWTVSLDYRDASALIMANSTKEGLLQELGAEVGRSKKSEPDNAGYQ